MKLKECKKKIFLVIKVISTALMASAIGLELGNIYATINYIEIPSSLNLIFPIERFAVASHCIEGIIAAFYASSRKKMPIQYATYTFFVGTVGLLELFDRSEI